MKVLCKTTTLTPEQKAVTGLDWPQEWYQLEPGKIYTVFAISYNTNQPGGVFIDVPGSEYILNAPICLFEVIDDRPSRYWIARKYGEHNIYIWPKELFIEFFHDYLTDLEPEYMAIYQALRVKLEHEFD
ncbi:hypothetical protein THUN1379_25820 [Paludibacterium sp. THUN1379]|uniref:hypothetical protein n=1 Tax=Paludibacterium sp. THUN1379 TaxID=3112107 RepID=UPI00308AC78D|nr:hypothetical protein THUN1379_25820 [Paludibacterium sp. THUN1379]